MRRLSIIMMLCAGLLAGCGGSQNFTAPTSTNSGSGGSGSGSGSGGSTTTTIAASLTAISSAASIPSDGSATATITVLARNSNNDLISGVDVTFSASSGGIAVTQATTDSTGSATATLSVAGDPTLRTITVTATASGLTATVDVQVVQGSGATTTVVSSLTMSSSAPSIFSDGSTSAVISALAVDASNNALAGVPVNFSASSGALQVTAATTAANGIATATLTAGGDTTPRTITITGKTTALTSTTQVQVVVPTTPAAPIYSMGNGSGAAFVAGKIALSVSGNLAAGGATGLQISIVDQTGTLYTGAPVVITFNSPCIASGLAEILPSGSSTPATTITTSSGSVNATYAATGCTGADIITASATVATQSVSATATVNVSASTIGSIQFVSATPTIIGLKGTGLNETSTVIFKVLDSTGGAKSGVTVSFALDSTVGGMSLSPATATTASDGTVQTVVSSGTVHTVVRVTASIASPALSTQSSQLTVTTGLPASAAFSIATGPATYGNTTSSLGCPNVETFNTDGVTVPISVRLADRYNNPVPDGTAVVFNTNGGHIVGSCTTPSTTPGDGTCVATWTSANPRPMLADDTPPLKANGRATILATTIGEESFTDIQGSGFWQTGDPFANLGEPYRDDNENGVYDSGEYFLDFNQNGKWDTGTGSFVGITCTGITAGSTCTTSTLAIGVSHLLIMSTGAANISVVSTGGDLTAGGGGYTIPVGDAGTLTFNVQDANGNSMAAGTTITSAYSSSAGTWAQTPATFTIGCNGDLGGQDIQGIFTASGNAGSGELTITVISPSGTTSIFSVLITVT